MGVSRNDYIVYGWKLPYEMNNSKGEPINFWDDKFLSMVERHQGEEFTIIHDGMCGNYTVFGLMLNRVGDEYEGWNFVNLHHKSLDAEKVKRKYREVFDCPIDEVITEPYLFIFSHFS